ncbi:MAG: hypothetical protein ACRYFS_24315 [Janthinobacterium lividum]
MNFLAHYLLATRYLTPSKPLSAYVVGTALPDLLPLASGRVRLRPAQIERINPRTELEAALSAGVSVHLATDAAFHKSPAFGEAQAEVGQMLAEAAFDGIRVRRFFVAHVLTEIALDAVLLRTDPSIADDFYAAFASTDFEAVTHWTEAVTGEPLPTLAAVLARFARSEYLRQYQSDEGVASGLSQLCRRARQDTFDHANFTRLVSVVKHAMSRLPEFVPALFSETAALIFSAKQEDANTAANAGFILKTKDVSI